MSDFTPEQVERAAEALWFGAGRGSLYGWGNLSETSRQAYLLYAEKILSAAGAPEKPAPVVDEAALEALRRVRELHAETPYDTELGPICSECTRINRYGVTWYPCPTMDALRGDSK